MPFGFQPTLINAVNVSKLVAIVAFAVAAAIKLTWRHSNFSLAFPTSRTVSRGFGLNEISFWVFVVVGLFFALRVLRKRKA